MTSRVVYAPEAEQQLDQLDDWIAERVSPDTARTFIRAVLDHCEGILVFPLAGRDRGDVRPSMRTTTFKRRILIAYSVDSSGGEVVVSVLGIFPCGQDWESTLRV